jgi:hypothetical protein
MSNSLPIPCPKCGRLVVLPENGEPRWWVRCPLCKREYILKEILNYAPPPLEVMHKLTASAPKTLAEMAALKAQSPESMSGSPAGAQSVQHAEFDDEGFAAESTAPSQTSAAQAAEIAALSAAQPAPTAALDAAAAAAVAIATQQPAPAKPIAASAAPAQPTKKPSPIDDDSWMTGVPVARPISNRSTGNRRRSSTNASIELLKIVMCGVVGLALGYAILRYGMNIDLAKLSQQASATTATDQSPTK